MSFIITEVFKATIGLLVNKGRDKAADRLDGGDVTEQKLRGLIIRELQDIKHKLDCQARKDLFLSISYFKEGMHLMHAVVGKATQRRENDASTVQVSKESASDEGFSLVKEMRKVEISGLDESAAKSLDLAKESFKEALKKARKAFANEDLGLSDRLLAMQYRIMATILELVDNPENALRKCKVCIEELHGLSAVQRNFNVEFTRRGMLALFGKQERDKIIANVCHVNRVIYDVTKMISKEFVMLPYVDTGGEKVDPFYDGRVARLLKKQGMEHCCARWSFGQEGAGEHKLMGPACGIAANSDRQFLIPYLNTLKVFDSKGNFHDSVTPQTNSSIRAIVYDVATSEVYDNNIYLLVGTLSVFDPATLIRSKLHVHVHVLNRTTDLQHKFPIPGVLGHPRLAVSRGKMLILKNTEVIDVYNKHNGNYDRSVGKGMISVAEDITASKDGLVMVLDVGQHCVHVFTVEGQQLDKFNVNVQGKNYDGIACHPAGEHFVLAGKETVKEQAIVDIYTMGGDLVRNIRLGEILHQFYSPKITVSQEGHIAVVVTDDQRKTRVIVF